MRSLPILGASTDEQIDILCIGAHCDDIEIGCGATLLQLLARSRVNIVWAAFSSDSERDSEFRTSASKFLQGARNSEVLTWSFRDSFFPANYEDIKTALATVREKIDPDMIFTHHKKDAHQDHRLVSEITWNVFRNHMILEYEIPKYDGDLTTPNVYVSVTQEAVEQKIDNLMSCYPSQSNKEWYSEETFRAVMRLRGIECASPSGWAEGFHAPKLVVSV